MGFKQIIKRIPGVQNSIHKIKNWMWNRERESYNQEYENHIRLLFRREVFEEKVDAIKRSIQRGDNVRYYIVATENTKLGIFGYVNCFLPHIAYAIAKGYVPVIDMQHYKSIYQVSNENVWETFFDQPFGIGLDSITNGKVLRCPTSFWYHKLPSSFPLMNERELNMWSMCVSACIKMTERSQLYLLREQEAILTRPEKTIGVIYRGTTYTKGEAKGHPIQPTMKMLADKAEEILQRHDLQYLYVASDEKSIVDYLNKRFPGRVLINQRVYYDEVENYDFSKYNTDGTDLDAGCFSRENNEYLIGIEYISSINLVAHCSCFVGGACGGTTAALLLNNNKYQESYVFQLGRYGFDPVPKE